MAEDVTHGLPPDLVSVLRDQSIVVPQDAAVFELIAAWAKAPSSTAGYEPAVQSAPARFEALCQDSGAVRSTTGVGC